MPSLPELLFLPLVSQTVLNDVSSGESTNDILSNALKDGSHIGFNLHLIRHVLYGKLIRLLNMIFEN